MPFKKYKKLSIIIPAKNCAIELKETIDRVIHYLDSNEIIYELIIIINNSTEQESQQMIEICSLYNHIENFKFENIICAGKGEAIHFGIKKSTGDNLCFIDADSPYELTFIKKALEDLANGYDLVACCRRMSTSTVELPYNLIKNLHYREKQSKRFNFLVNKFLGINSPDTQAGMKCFTRKIANIVFNKKYCKGFLFDIELFLACKQNNLKYKHRSTKLHLKNDNSTVSPTKELFSTLYWLFIFIYRNLNSSYKTTNTNELIFTSDDWGISPSVNKGIYELAKKQIVKKVSIMPEEKYFNYYLKELRELENVQFGLHLNLSHNSIFPGPKKMILDTLNPLKKRKIKKEVQIEINSQIKKLQESGLKISYIDGHHHCHILPVINKIVISECKKNDINFSRIPFCKTNFFNEKIILNLFSTIAYFRFKKGNINFHKFYYPNFNKITNINEFQKKLVNKNNYEIITHPSIDNDFELLKINDTYSQQRVHEFKLLSLLEQ